MKKTLNRILQLKFHRTLEQKNTDYLRKANLLGLESLRFFTKDFSVADFKDTFLRMQEIFFMNA